MEESRKAGFNYGSRPTKNTCVCEEQTGKAISGITKNRVKKHNPVYKKKYD
jgi:hypothetical protein